jgi:hypothetical protein
MKPRITLLASLALSACATTKTPAPLQPTAATPSASVATQAAPAAGPAVADAELAHWAKNQGYTQTTAGQRLLWCKEDSNVGSRIPQRTCLTEAKLAMIRQVSEQNKQTLLRTPSVCPQAVCTSGK